MSDRFAVGSRVTWKSGSGRASGTVTIVHTTDFELDSRTHRATPADPQYEVVNHTTGHIVARRASSLRPADRAQFFTIGHSTRTLDEFVELLVESSIRVVADVRRLPGSKRYPHFDQDALAKGLRDVGVEYWRVEGLTGRRPVSKDVDFDVNAWWQNRSFHNYADHALSEEFATALGDVRERGRNSRVAIMCSEAVWWRCHRRIIADHLLASDEDVRHILGTGHVDDAQLSPGAVLGPHGQVTYPATATGS